MKRNKRLRRWIVWLMLIGIMSQVGCARLQLPTFDPSGNRLFLPNGQTTQLLGPNSGTGGGLFGSNPLRGLGSHFGGQTASGQPPQLPGNFQPAPFSPAINSQTVANPQFPTQPAFQHPADPPPCNQPNQTSASKVKYVIPKPGGKKTPGQKGQIIMTPSRIVAPVNSEVVVLAGICGDNGYFVRNQPLEWMLSNNSVGQFIEVGGMGHDAFNRLVPPTAKKIDGQYAWGRTGLKNVLLTRGTPTPVDDIELLDGQTFVSVSSASPGTTYVTGVAPKAEGWDRRRASSVIHWVDGQWSIPAPTSATSGTVHPLTTVVSRISDSGGVEDWIVRYKIVGGAPAEFAPSGSQVADAKTDREGQATVQLRQPAGQTAPGTTQVRVDVVRPPVFGEPELVVESGITNVTWSAPALTIRAIGPRYAEVDQPFNYRVEVSNPGDQISRDVVVRTKNLDDSIEFISSNPKPTEYGNVYEWSVGDIPPGAPPRVIDVQLKSQKRGNTNMCFEVASQTDRLQTEACAETEITAPCLNLGITGPTTAQVGDSVTFNLDIQNVCDEPLEGLQLVVRHDQGLLRPGKSNPSTFELPILQFGESRSPQLTFQTIAPGTQCIEVEISAQGQHAPVREKRCLEVAGPTSSVQDPNRPPSTDVDFQILGGQPMEVGGLSPVTVRVTNTSNVPMENVLLTNRFSPSLEVVEISDAYNQPNWLDENYQEFATLLGRIDPGQTVDVDLLYRGIMIDEQASNDFSVTTASGISATDRIEMQVKPAGGLAPGSGQPGTGGGPVQPDFSGMGGGAQSENGSGSQSGSQIGIPDDPSGQSASLAINVETIDRQIQVINSSQPNPNLPNEARIKFSVTNTGQRDLRDVELTILVPPGTQLTNFYQGDTNLKLVDQSPDGRQFYVEKIRELKYGETLNLAATVKGLQPGMSTFEVQGQSPDLTSGSSSRDTIVILE